MSTSTLDDEPADDGLDAAQKELPPAVRARIERNRQRAILLRSSRLAKRQQPYNSRPEKILSTSTGTTHVVDTGAGFFLDPDEEEEAFLNSDDLVEEEAPIIGPDQHICTECRKPFMESYLAKHFDVFVCDECRDPDDKHSLTTKTDAKQEYCLRDYDFEGREPALKFILRKNPHNPRWGEMKLFLKEQVRQRALEVWESEEKIAEQKELKSDNREKQKQKKYDKKIKELRRAVRTSTWTRDLSKHEHAYGPEEVEDAEEDTFRKTCTTCGYTVTFEKM